MNLAEFLKTEIPVVEVFSSISGEGITQGQLVTFVRTGGCNLRCTYCDTPYSYGCDEEHFAKYTPEEILAQVQALGCKDIIFTGGEPLEEGTVKRLVPYYLAQQGYNVRIETNGSCRLNDTDNLFDLKEHPVYYVLDFKCPSSKMESFNKYEQCLAELKAGDELKFVMADDTDMDFSMDVIKKYSKIISEKDVVINFSSVYSKLPSEKIVKMMTENNSFFSANGLRTRISLQLHKIIWAPQTRGV